MTSYEHKNIYKYTYINIIGSELIALKGATEALQHIEVVTSEVSVFNTNEGTTINTYIYLSE